MYRRRRKISEKLQAAMQAGRERSRVEGEPRSPALQPPNLRRRITIEDFDFGHVTHTVELYRTNRIDCYRAVADGKPWRERIGWSNVLTALRKSLVRIRADA